MKELSQPEERDSSLRMIEQNLIQALCLEWP